MPLNDLEEIRYEYEEEKEDPFKKLIGGIPEKYFFAILVVILIAFYLVSQGYITFQQIVLYVGLAIIAILFMSYKNARGDSYLTYKEALALSESFVKDMQRLRKIPFGDAKVTILGRLRKSGRIPDEYACHVRVTSNEFLVSDYELVIDPKKAGLGVIGCIDAKTGFNALRRPEHTFQASPEMYMERQRNKYMETGKFQ